MPANHPKNSSRTLIVVGIFKLINSALLAALGFGLLHLLHSDIQSVLHRWIDSLRVDPGNRYLHTVLSALPGVTPEKLKLLSVGTFLYSAIYGTEGVGLVLRKRWAEYLTILSTVLLLPIEIVELIHRASVAKVIVLIVNLAIGVYLIVNLIRDRKHHAQ